MKTVVKTKIVSEEQSETVYVCENCDFEANYRSEMRTHEFINHQIKEKREIHGATLYWLDDYQDMYNLIESDICYGTETVDGKFEEPGWYGIYTYEDYDSYYGNVAKAEVKPLRFFIETWNNDIESANHSLHDAYELLEKKK